MTTWLWSALAAVLIAFSNAWATNYIYYVDLDAPPAGTGSANAPWQALSNAVPAINAIAGDHTFTVNVASGVYADVSNGGLEAFGVAAAYTLTNKAANLNGADQRVVTLMGGYAGYSGSGYDWTTRIVRTTVIDLQGANARALTVAGSNTSLSVNGIVFRNGNATGNGGALNVTSPGTGGNNGSLQLNYCLFSNNVASGRGGAVYVQSLGTGTYTWRTNDFINNRAAQGGAVRFAMYQRVLTFADCVMSGNQATNGNGGALLIGDGDYGQATLTRCLLADNSATATGGVSFRQPGNLNDPLTFNKCTVLRNSAPAGSVAYDLKFGVQVWNDSLIASNTASASGWTLAVNAGLGGAGGGVMTLQHCTVADNTGGGLYCQNSYAANNGDLDVRNCILANNGAVGIQTDDLTPTVDYNAVLGHTANYVGLSAGAHDLSVDPQFTTLLGNPYMLQKTSPCLDSATNLAHAADLLGAFRPLRAGYDRGAYEESFLPLVTNLPPVAGSDKAILRGQLTYDGQTNCLMQFFWGTTDGVTNKVSWATNETLGPIRAGVAEALVTGLTPGQTYYYRACASNWYDEVWASTSTAFVALANVHTALWACAVTNPLASNPTNWSGTLAPTRLSVIVLDGSCVSNMIWDSAAPAEVWAWDQRAGYTGTATVDTVYGTSGLTNFAVYTDCQVNSGVMSHRKNVSSPQYRLKMTVGGNLLVGSGARISAQGVGYNDGQGPGVGLYQVAGGSHGGQGSRMSTGAGNTYGSFSQPVTLGSGGIVGGVGNGHGGGAIHLTVAGTATVSGTIDANAFPSSSSLSAGAGGSVYLKANALAGTGFIKANGDKQGGGGRVAVVLTGSDSFGGLFLQAYGGTDANLPGSAGTVYRQGQSQGDGAGTLVIDNNNQGSGFFGSPVFSYASALMPAASAWNGAVNLNALSEVVVTNRGILGVNADTALDWGTAAFRFAGVTSSYVSVSGTNALVWPAVLAVSNYTLLLDRPVSVSGDWVVASNGVISCLAPDNRAQPPLTLSLVGDLTVAAGGAITVEGAGFRNNTGTGVGSWSPNRGGGYGGQGGVASWLPGQTYGSFLAPTNFGSGGVSGGNNLADGGGAIRLTVSGACTVDGTINANAKPGYAGSGGSIYLTAGSLAGSGLLTASGASGASGGGGRIAVILTNGTSFGSVNLRAFGGTQATAPGAAGTIYRETAAQGGGKGMLTIDNNGLNSNTNAATPLIPGLYAVTDELARATVVITNKARVALPANATVGNVYVTGSTNSLLDLKGNTLRVNVTEHALGGGTVLNYGLIIWKPRGTLMVLL